MVAREQQWFAGGRLPLGWLVLALGYVLSGTFALWLANTQEGVSPFWLPAGLMLAALLLFGYRLWPGIFLGVAAMAVLSGRAWGEMLGVAVAGSLEALFAAWLIGQMRPFQRIIDVLHFIAALMLAALPAAMLAGLFLSMDMGYGELVAHWWLGDVTGMLVVVPALLAWVRQESRVPRAPGCGWELTVFLLFTAGAAWLVFSGWLPSGDLVFLLLGLFLWAALRLGPRGSMSLSLLAVLAATFFSMRGQGPLLAPEPLFTQLTLQGFIVVAAVGGLIMVAAMQERAAALGDLRLSDRIINATPEHISILGPDHRYRRVNHTYELAHGMPMREIVGRHPAELLGEELYARRVRPNLERCFAGKEVHYGDWFNFNGSGRRYMMVTYLPLPDRDGRIDNIAVLSRDITEIKLAEERLQLAGQVIENTPDGVMITDAALHIRSVNPAFTTTTGYSEAEVVGQTPHLLASGRHDAAFYRAMWQQIERQGRWQGEIWNRRKNGEIYLEWLSIIAIRDEQGQVRHYAGIFSDIVTQEHVRKRLHSLAYYDALTDLPNRELFHDRLHNALVQARREGRQMALLFLDVDQFKPVNDNHGHSTGDSLLRVIADTLRQCVRESDMVARLGGDEFTIILPGLSGPDAAAQVADKILAAFARPFPVDGHALSVGASIGIALFPEDGQDEAMLLRNADAAMYAAKQAGRNTWQRFQTHMAALFDAGRRGT